MFSAPMSGVVFMVRARGRHTKLETQGEIVIARRCSRLTKKNGGGTFRHAVTKHERERCAALLLEGKSP